MSSVRVLAISGSLRAHSSNTTVLRAVSILAPPDVELELLSGLDVLPHFNPDLDVPGRDLPPGVRDFRRRVGSADALMFSCPEYAHGMPGTLKNALDWLVSGPEVVGKPAALVNPSPRAWHAQASLAETLRTMSMRLVPATSIVVPVMGREMDAATIANDPQFAAALRGGLDALVRAARVPG